MAPVCRFRFREKKLVEVIWLREKQPAKRLPSYKAAGSFAENAQDFDRRRKRLLSASSLPVTIPRGSHPFPSRTRKLSLAGPMVLHEKLCGRLGDRRHNYKKPALRSGLFRVYGHFQH